MKEENFYQYLDASPLSKSGGKAFFIEATSDTKVDNHSIERVKDRTSWSPSRKKDYDYYEKSLANQNRDGVLLDIGSGSGLFRELFSQFRYIGMDFHPHDVVSIVTDVTQPLPIKNGIADIAVISNVLEHTPEPQLLINECYRVLKPGGLLLGSVPFMAHEHNEPYDFLRYTHFMLERMFKKAGFKNIQVVPLEQPADFYEWSQTRFFDSLIYETKLGRVDRLQALFARKMTRLGNKIFRRVFYKSALSYKLSRRFGFTAEK